jgi:hypothetical protein
MARINTKVGLRDYVKSQLGYPTINIEVTDAQIDEIIDDCVQKFTEYAYGTLEDTVVMQFTGSGDYPVPDTITNVIKLSKGTTSSLGNFGSYVPDIWSEQYFSSSLTGDIIGSIVSVTTNASLIEKYLGDELHYNFNHLKKNLQVLENYTGPVVLHYQYEYIADENNDFVYNHEWVKNYSKAKVKELWGTVTGKYDQALVGGARINYEKLSSEARDEIQKLDEELLDKWSDPCPIMVG